MPGKRPDQYHSDLAGAGPSDQRNMLDEKLHAREKEELTTQQAETHREGLIPERGTNPALAELQAKREAAREEALPDAADRPE